MLYHTPMCTLHVYKPTVQPVGSVSLFLDIQEVTLLLKEFTCLHVQMSATPLPGHAHFSTIFVAHVHVYVRWDVREASVNLFGAKIKQIHTHAASESHTHTL